MKFLLLLLLAGEPVLQTTPAKMSGVVALSAIATDSPTPLPNSTNTVPGCGIQRVEWRVNGNLIGTASTASSVTTSGPAGQVLVGTYAFNWNTATLPDGVYTMEVRSFDRSGGPSPIAGGECDGKSPNPSDPRTVQIEIDNVPADNTPPTIQIVTPKQASVVSGRTNVAVNAQDSDGIVSMALSIVSSRGRRESVRREGVDSLTYNWNTNPYRGDTVDITASAADGLGNTADQSITVRVLR